MTDQTKQEQKPHKLDRKKRNEVILFAGILIAALLLLLVNQIRFRSPAANVEVLVDREVIGNYPLDQDLDMIIESTGGGTNHLVIQNSRVSITEASCPDKVCVHTGAISENGQVIACLPNRVAVTIK